jgi:hypothetical protein
MENQPPSSNQQEDTTNRGRRHLGNLFKPRTSQGDQPHGVDHIPRPRSPSLLSRFKKSPDPKPGKTRNAQPTTDVNSATSKSTLDDSRDAQSAVKTAAEDSDKDNDMWTTAEKRLREDPQKRKKLEEYDRILEEHFGARLEPIGTPERREQFRGFLNSEIEKLNDADSDTRLSRCSNKAKRFFKSAAACVIASKDIIAPATAACLPAAVACTGVVVILSVSFAIEYSWQVLIYL